MEGPEPAQGQDWRPALLEDWLTIWHSELAAMVLDPELQEAKLRLLDTWAAQARLLLRTAAWRGSPDGAWPAPSGSAGPGRRRGPRPLLLHLMPAMPSSSGWPPGSSNSSASWPGADPALIRGIAAYRQHPYMRDLADPPMIWSEGAARVLDYGGDGPSVLFVPSLVNRAYILDLMPGQSMMRWFAGRGVRPLLLDWGWPGAAERDFTLTDYVAGVLERAIGFLAGAGTEVWAGAGPIVLGGYCMGGLLTLAASLRRPALVRGLALLATPWDFAAGGAAREVPALLPLVEPLLHATRTLPVDALQTLFALGDMGGSAGSIASSAPWTRAARPHGGSWRSRTGRTTAFHSQPRWRGRRWAAGMARTRRQAGRGGWQEKW